MAWAGRLGGAYDMRPVATRGAPDRTAADARVCVIIPCYGDGAFVAGSVASIREEEPVETVVVDDGSSDVPTRDALIRIEDAGITVLRHDGNRGVSASRDSALAATSAPFVFSLDADDLLMPGTLSAMADRLESAPAASVCYGDYVELTPRDVLLRAVPDELDPYRLAFTNEFPSSALFRRSALTEVGGWQPLGISLDIRSDWSLWLTLAERGKQGVHLGAGRTTYVHRIHEGRLTSRARPREREIRRALRASHPDVFEDIASHRRRSTLPRHRKALYPLYDRVYMPRLRLRGKQALDRLGVWTLKRDLAAGQREEVLRGVSEAEARAARLLGVNPAGPTANRVVN